MGSGSGSGRIVGKEKEDGFEPVPESSSELPSGLKPNERREILDGCLLRGLNISRTTSSAKSLGFAIIALGRTGWVRGNL